MWKRSSKDKQFNHLQLWFVEFEGSVLRCILDQIKPAKEGFIKSIELKPKYKCDESLQVVAYGKTVTGDWGVFNFKKNDPDNDPVAIELFRTEQQAINEFEDLLETLKKIYEIGGKN